jgi:hypothetical protein
MSADERILLSDLETTAPGGYVYDPSALGTTPCSTRPAT